MITCQHARQLFDRHLDGELSPSLQAELHAHQLNCSGCQTELAILQACGDVIAGDRREPSLGPSFTDRVLLSHRAQNHPRPRHWGRTFLLFGSPMAAAASIAFAILLIAPSIQERPEPQVSGTVVAQPKPMQEAMQHVTGRQPSPEEQAALDSTPEMPAFGLVEQCLGPIVAQTRDTFERARGGAAQFESLLYLGISDINDKLVANWQSAQRDDTDDESPDAQAINEMDLLDPAYPSEVTEHEELSNEPQPTPLFDAL